MSSSACVGCWSLPEPALMIGHRAGDAVHQRRSARGVTRLGRPHHDDVNVRAEGADAVVEALALHFRGRCRIADLAGANAEDVAGVVEGQERAGGGLREVEHRPHLRGELLQRHGALGRLGNAAHVRRQQAELVEQRPVEAAGVDDVEERACHDGAHDSGFAAAAHPASPYSGASRVFNIGGFDPRDFHAQ